MSRVRLPRPPRVDLVSLAGIPLGIGLIVLGLNLEGGNPRSLLQTTAALIVFGGTFGAVLVSFSLGQVKDAAVSAAGVFRDDPDDTEARINAILRYARAARRDGILSLEDTLDTEKDPFLRKGLSLAVDGTNAHMLREMLEGETLSREERDEMPARVFESAAGYSPTMGILGAVLGLIHVMESLSDPSRLGAGIAVAFVATVYGVGSANLVFLPVATRLRLRAKRAARRRELTIEGVLAIHEGLSLRLIDQKLRALSGRDSVEEPARRRTAA